MPGLALALLGSYLAVVVLLRAAVQRRRTGSFGFRLHLRPRGAEILSGPLISFAFVGLPAGMLAQARGVVDGWWVVGRAQAAVVVGVVVVGALATFFVQLQLGDSWRIGVDPAERTALVTRGVYARIRNPIYTALVGCVGAIASLALNAVTAAALVALVAALEVQVRRVEEPYLARLHGRAFADYAATTGRFLPGIGRGRVAGERG